jgi:hypothetical protein
MRSTSSFRAGYSGSALRDLTGGSDVGYIVSAGRADVQRLRAVRLDPR